MGGHVGPGFGGPTASEVISHQGHILCLIPSKSLCAIEKGLLVVYLIFLRVLSLNQFGQRILVNRVLAAAKIKPTISQSLANHANIYTPITALYS